MKVLVLLLLLKVHKMYVHIDSTVWLTMHKITLLQSDRDYICTNGTPLNDKHINLAQRILKTQCPHVDGLQSTLLQPKGYSKRLSSGIQVVHCHGNHWITAYKPDVGNDVIHL